MSAYKPDRVATPFRESTDDAAGDRNGWSLRIRLIVLLLIATCGLWGFAAWTVYLETRRDAHDLFDESLRETAHLLLTIAEHEMGEHGPDYADQLIGQATYPATHYLRFQIWDNNGRLIYRSVDTPATPLISLPTGYAWVALLGEPVRAYSAWNETHTLQIQLAEPLSYRQTVTQRSLSRLAIGAAVLLPVSAALVWWIIQLSFSPIQRISTAISARAAQDLGAVEMAQAPREVQPLLLAFNRLLERVRQQIEHERRFTADAAHELRTPLAAIRAHAQVLLGARSAGEAAEAAHDIINGVDRSRRSVDQLLTLARLDQQPLGKFSAVALNELIDVQVAAHSAPAAKHNITLRSETQPAQVQGNADALDMMLRNLIDNALRYTPAGGEVLVSCSAGARGVELSVSDSGPGIPAAEHERVFERFYRMASSESYGSGLGLSIVQRVIEQHGAQLSIGPGLHGAGACFAVLFAAPTLGMAATRRHA